MLYHDNKWFYFYKGKFVETTISRQDATFTYFDNGEKHLTAEINNTIQDYQTNKATRIINRIEYKRLNG